MASHHLHNHHHRHGPAAAPLPPCCCGGGGGYYSTCCAAPPPPEPLLLHPSPPYAYSSCLYPPYDHQTRSFRHHQQMQVGLRGHDYNYDPQHQQPVISSLLRRIAALESIIRGQHSVDSGAYSLRDAAARTIQTHFRAFLARRSRTVRQLKELASIKSNLNAIKASISDNAYLNFPLISRRALDLLYKLDSIQAGDPMIRTSKRSISREIILLLEFIDGASMNRDEFSSTMVKSERLGLAANKSRASYSNQKIEAPNLVNSGGDEKELKEKLRTRIKKLQESLGVSKKDDNKDAELGKPRISMNGVADSSPGRNGNLVKGHDGDQIKTKKNVSFADILDPFEDTEPNSSEDGNGVEEGSGSSEEEPEIKNNLNKDAKEIKEEEKPSTQEGLGYLGRRTRRRNFIAEARYGTNRENRAGNRNYVFTLPLPLYMEGRADMMNVMDLEKIIK